MGRKGMKSFLKGVAHQPAEAVSPDDAAASTADVTAPEAEAATAAKTSHNKPAPAAKPVEKSTDVPDRDEEASPGEETRGQMLQRHKREMMAHKKALTKLGKSKKDEAARLTTEIHERHERELKSLEEAQEKEEAPAAEVASSMASLQVSQEPAGAKKTSKAKKRKEKLLQQEAEREARIAAEQEAAGPSDRQLEEAGLVALLRPHQLQIREIRADGHCLYRAVQDQLEQSLPSTPAQDYLQLRRLAAEHMRSHPDDYLPFMMDEDGEGGEPMERLEAYCRELESTACWGGQMELRALAEALKRHIRVYAVGMPEVDMGEQHKEEGTLRVCYLRHAFGLGEHYNSVEPAGGEEDADEDGGSLGGSDCDA